MTIEQLGSIGEFISSIAVVISLIYLAIQVRHNSAHIHENVKALRRNEANETMRGYSNLRGHVISDESFADILVRGRTVPETLSEPERERVRAYSSEAIWMNYQIWSRVREGFLDEGQWERGQKGMIAGIVQSQPGREAWESSKVFLESDFVEAVEAQFNTPDPTT